MYAYVQSTLIMLKYKLTLQKYHHQRLIVSPRDTCHRVIMIQKMTLNESILKTQVPICDIN